MSLILDVDQRNAVLKKMAQLVQEKAEDILATNAIDMANYTGKDVAMKDRLKVDNSKIAGMIQALHELIAQPDPIGVERYAITHENGMQITNKTAPFGTVMIIYESRPDVTIEAAGIAFKSANKILLKGGKESLKSNLLLVKLWQEALKSCNCNQDWVTYLNYSRKETQDFLEQPTQKLDLIVPRGGEKLIQFVKENASCPVIISGRGNNFLYVAPSADKEMAIQLIINAKTAKISACNALDKVLIDENLPEKEAFIKLLNKALLKANVEVFTDKNLEDLEEAKPITNPNIWEEEFLDYKIVLGQTKGLYHAIEKINKHSGGHSASIVTSIDKDAEKFMAAVDSAAVYHNASTRFTDGGQFGLAGELAISTDKLHQRGPIGLNHLVTNKWYVKGNGQVR